MIGLIAIGIVLAFALVETLTVIAIVRMTVFVQLDVGLSASLLDSRFDPPKSGSM